MLVLVMAAGMILPHAAAARDQNQPNSLAHDFVIFASVFHGQGFALPGAKVCVRRANEGKFRWEGISDSRGELGIRVKQGAEYQLMEPLAGGKP
jgi:hypothetical protein